MKKFVVLLMVVFWGCATLEPGTNNKSNYDRKDCNLPKEYSTEHDEMTGANYFISPGIMLTESSIFGKDQIGVHFSKVTAPGHLAYHMIVKAYMREWSFFDAVYIKINEDIIYFSGNNLTYKRDVIFNGRVFETVECRMDFLTMKKIISADVFKISIRGQNQVVDFYVNKEPEWQRMIDGK